jgi:hypothetical protein
MLGYILAAGCVLVTAPIWIIEHRRKSTDNIADDLPECDPRLEALARRVGGIHTFADTPEG